MSSFAVSREKRAFIKKVAPGISTCMAVSYKADEIAAAPEDEIELYIRNNLLVFETGRWWFSDSKFIRAVDTLSGEKLTELLVYLDDIDMNLYAVYRESCLEWSKIDCVYDELVETERLITFEELLKM